MFSVGPNIVLAPNMTQNAERKHRTQNTNTAHIRPPSDTDFIMCNTVEELTLCKLSENVLQQAVALQRGVSSKILCMFPH